MSDNLGTDIDHFEPVRRAPLRAFDWPNHLLACGFCNSNGKRGQYPCDDAGTCLLIDPTSEEPRDHLQLILRTGRYHGLTSKGIATIATFGLNRADLVRGRANAFLVMDSMICHAKMLIESGDDVGAARRLRALLGQPHASVLHGQPRAPTPALC